MAKKKAAAYRLAKLSLTLRGISHNLGETNHFALIFQYTIYAPLDWLSYP